MSDGEFKGFNGKFIFIGTVAAATASAVIFLFLQFETKADSAEKHLTLESRLIRIEEKVDRLLERSRE